MHINFYLVIGIASLILGGCTLSNNASISPTPTPTPTPSPVSSTSIYTAAEVATHNSAVSCWIIINAKVYDVTQFIPNHPGGEKILTGCGNDMTPFITTEHKPIDDRLPQFIIGDLQN